MSDKNQPEVCVEEQVTTLPGDFDSRLGDLVLNRSWITEGHYEKKSWLYWLLLPALLLVALYCAIKYYAYVAFVRPKNKARLMLGPKRGLWFLTEPIGSWTRPATASSAGGRSRRFIRRRSRLKAVPTGSRSWPSSGSVSLRRKRCATVCAWFISPCMIA